MKSSTSVVKKQEQQEAGDQKGESFWKGEKVPTTIEAGDQKDESFWTIIAECRTIARNAQVDDETKQQAFEKLFKRPEMIRTSSLICSSLRRGLKPHECQHVEDIFQDSIIKVVQSIAGFKGENEHEFRGWVWRIAKNTSLDFGRSVQRNKLVFFDVIECASSENPFNVVLLNEWLDSLSDQQRSIVDLRKEGMTLEEIAADLGLSRSGVHRQLNEAHKKLKMITYGRKERKGANPKVRKKTK